MKNKRSKTSQRQTRRNPLSLFMAMLLFFFSLLLDGKGHKWDIAGGEESLLLLDMGGGGARKWACYTHARGLRMDLCHSRLVNYEYITATALICISAASTATANHANNNISQELFDFKQVFPYCRCVCPAFAQASAIGQEHQQQVLKSSLLGHCFILQVL